MSRVISVALLVGGVLLLYFGGQSFHSINDNVSRLLGAIVATTKDARATLVWGADEVVYAPSLAVTGVHADAIAGFAEFASPLSALAAPAAFLGLHLLEGEVVTPHLVGHQLALDPVMVFLALVVLGWLWGVAGLLLAVPLMACAKIVAGRVLEGDLLATLLAR